MKAPWYSKINWLAVAIFLPAALELWRSSPLSVQYPNLALWIALIGSIAILALRTFFTAEATTLATESTKRTARRQRRKTDQPVVVGTSGKVVAPNTDSMMSIQERIEGVERDEQRQRTKSRA